MSARSSMWRRCADARICKSAEGQCDATAAAAEISHLQQHYLQVIITMSDSMQLQLQLQLQVRGLLLPPPPPPPLRQRLHLPHATATAAEAEHQQRQQMQVCKSFAVVEPCSRRLSHVNNCVSHRRLLKLCDGDVATAAATTVICDASEGQRGLVVNVPLQLI